MQVAEYDITRRNTPAWGRKGFTFCMNNLRVIVGVRNFYSYNKETTSLK
jgi:hypothetical protein